MKKLRKDIEELVEMKKAWYRREIGLRALLKREKQIKQRIYDAGQRSLKRETELQEQGKWEKAEKLMYEWLEVVGFFEECYLNYRG